MRTKDRPIFLERAIKDVLAQSYKQWHLCIVNDSSDKKTVEDIVKKSKLDKNQLTLIHNTKKIPQDALINVGIKNTKNELIVVHDDDDTWHPDFLKKCVAKLQEPMDYADVGGVVTKVDKIYEKVKGDKIIKVGVGHFGYYKEQKSFLFINDIFSDRFKIWTMAFIFRRSCLDIVGLYDEKLPVLGDMDFNFRFIKNFDIAFIDETLAHYHRRPQLKGVAGNSINSGTIETYQNLVFNKYIREDFNKGKLNFGAAIMQARYFYRLNKDLMENRFYYKFKRFVKLIIKKLLFRG